MPTDLQYERELQKLKDRAAARIRKAYEDAITTIAIKATSITKLKDLEKSGRIFRIKDYPTLLATIEKALKGLHTTIYAVLINSIADSWDLSNQKNNALVDKRIANKALSDKAKGLYYDANLSALKAFMKRKEKGLNLSQRVWKVLDNYKIEMEGALGVGISEGKPATKLASELKQYLNEPDKLFRRVRDQKGKLKLSKAARTYSPGQGVYRSSFANAKRLTRNEINISYRLSDQERWAKIPFIIGTKIVLSNRHPVYDMCNELNKSIYPKEFVWSGWHVNCLCHRQPVMLSEEEFDKYENYILTGEGKPNIPYIKQMPGAFNKWVLDNRERIEGWKSKPYFITQNPRYVEKIVGKK